MTHKVPLIPQNLHKNETIIQIADSLDYLSRVVDDVFQHIENRIKLNTTKLEDVMRRVDCAERKISQIRGVKNAIKVFSSSKYPGADINRQYFSMFPLESDIVYNHHKIKQKYPKKTDEVLEKLHIYHVELSKVPKEKVDGLGELPSDIECINDILLYNTGKTLYKNFKISDSLKVSSPEIKSEEQGPSIGVAPVSIGEKVPFSSVQGQSYLYSPDLGEVPSLDIPQDLPDLPGIANNVRYIDDSKYDIAPSVGTSSVQGDETNSTIYSKQELDDLPEICPDVSSLTNIGDNKLEESNVKTEKLIKQENEPSIVPEEEESIKTDQIVHTNETQIHEIQNETKDLPVVLDLQASLMAAIREARGGKNLKTVNKSENVSRSESGSGNLMADLHAKLAMRRKGISGTPKTDENVGMDTRQALSKISALIPPPEDKSEETDQDEDWE